MNVRVGGDDPSGATLNAVNASLRIAICDDPWVSTMMKYEAA